MAKSTQPRSSRPAPAPGTEDREVQSFFDSLGRSLTAGAEASTYTLRRDDLGDLKLHVAIMRGDER
jgi:hypothetical protein